MDIENNMPEQTINNIKNLQDLEKQLYINLQNESKNNNKDRQTAIIKQINDISQTRINMFEQLKSVYQLLDNNFESDRNNLANELSTLAVVEKNLNNSKKQLKKLETNNANTLRMAEIDDFYSKKYNAYTKILQFLILLMIPVIIVVVLKRNQTISSDTSNVLFTIIIVIGLFYIGGSLFDLSRRNNMAFQEYDFPLNIKGSTEQGVIEYDLEQLGFLKDNIDNEFDNLSQSLSGECIGAECCAKDMIFNTKKSICQPKPKGKNATESFLSSVEGAPY
jgi:hypothetical protein